MKYAPLLRLPSHPGTSAAVEAESFRDAERQIEQRLRSLVDVGGDQELQAAVSRWVDLDRPILREDGVLSTHSERHCVLGEADRQHLAEVSQIFTDHLGRLGYPRETCNLWNGVLQRYGDAVYMVISGWRRFGLSVHVLYLGVRLSAPGGRWQYLCGGSDTVERRYDRLEDALGRASELAALWKVV